MLKDSVKVTGKVNILLTDASGVEKDKREIDNLVVLTGREFIASRMRDASAAVMSHMAVGTDNTAPAASDKNLGAEVSSSRTALTSTTNSSNTTTYTCTFNPGVGTGALVEAGIFNYSTPSGSPSAAEILLCRTIFAVINKGAADTLTISWTVTIN
jgi:hypothetical protein